MVYIKDCIPHRLLKDFSGSHEGIDYLTFEFVMKSRKWYISYFYKPPRVRDSVFCELLKSLCDTFMTGNNLYMALGDFNFNFLSDNKLLDLCQVYGLHNLITNPTCFKGDTPTLLDVVLTNMPKSFADSFNLDLGLSDFHNCIGVSSRMFAPSQKNRKIVYRSMKHFCNEDFQNDINLIPFHVADIFDDIDDAYWFSEKLFLSTLEKHAPTKTRTVKSH